MNTGKYLIHLFRFQPWVFGLDCLLSILFFVLPLAPGLIIREIFNLLTGEAQAGLNQWSLMGLLVIATTAHIIVLFTSEAVNVTLRVTASTLLQKNLLTGILARTRTLPISPGEAIGRFRDDVQSVENAVSLSAELAGIATLMITAFAIMLTINPLITLIAVVPLLIVVSLVNRAGRYIEQYHEANQEAVGRVTGFIAEIFGAIQLVKITTSEAQVISRFEQLNEQRQATAIKARMLEALLGSIVANISNFGLGLILLLVGQAMRTGSFTVGDLALFMLYLNWLVESTGFFGGFLVEYRQAGVSLGRLAQLTGEASPAALVGHSPLYLWRGKPPLSHAPKRDQDRLHQLRVIGLTYKHPGLQHSLKDINLTIQRGTLTVVTGRIGSGKSTLLRVLLGLLPKEAGQILWNEQEVTDPAAFFVPPQAAYVPQAPRLFTDSLRDNILLGFPADQAHLARVLQMAVLEESVGAMKLGLETMIGARGMRLSGGQTLRTAAARAFVREPELFIFDDLSSALDVETERLLLERAFKRDRATYLVVSHRPAVLRQADQIIVLKDGKVEATGTLSFLLETCAEMQALWQNSLKELK